MSITLFSADNRRSLQIGSEVVRHKETCEQTQLSLVVLMHLNEGDNFEHCKTDVDIHDRMCIAAQVPTSEALRMAVAFEAGTADEGLNNLYQQLKRETNPLESLRNQRDSIIAMDAVLSQYDGVTCEFNSLEASLASLGKKIAHFERMESDPEYKARHDKTRAMTDLIGSLLDR